MQLPVLSLTIWVPIIAGILVLFLNKDEHKPMARWAALAGAVLGLLVAIPLWTGFDAATASLQFVQDIPWINRFNIRYALGVDGISMPFILLNSFTTILVIIAAWEVIQDKVSQYLAAFLIMSGLINGVFAATDAILFYLFFEAMLIPMFLIIGIWGGPNRVYAAVKFFLYTLLGSLLMLAALIYLYNHTRGSFDIFDFHRIAIDKDVQILLFFAFFASFSVKVPMWPVHTWLPDAHVEAPAGGSVVLAAITLKIGAYGFLRFNLPIAPDASMALAGFMITLSLIAVVYIGLVALVQADMKKLIAYSSISHMGFCTLGFFMFNAIGVEGALVQMISHGFISAAMFLCVGVLYDRVHSREISAYGGVANKMPVFAAFAVLFGMANSGLPGTSGFVGEFMVILAAIKVNFWYGLLAATTLIFGAAYTLWMVKRVIFGEVANDNVAALTDVNKREILLLGSLAILVLFMGIYPKPFTDVMHVSVDALLKHVTAGKLPAMNHNILLAAPEILLLILIGAVMMADLFSKPENRSSTVMFLSVVTLIAVGAVAGKDAFEVTRFAFNGMYVADGMSSVLKVAMAASLLIGLVYSQNHLALRGLFTGEYVMLMLFALLGMMIMVSANNFVTLYLGLEIQALSVYTMVALQRDSARATEAAMKYFILGALASGLLLYGISMVYGATGSLDIEKVANLSGFSQANAPLLAFGLVFIVAGLAFKLGAVPFHMWVPDVYQGSSTPVTMLLSTAPKIAAFAFVLRILGDGLAGMSGDWQLMLVFLAVLSIGIGNVVAIAQTNLKRMLAYSTISHMGFLLLGILAASKNGYSSGMFYIITYALTALAAFGMILLLSREGFEADNLEDFKGLNQRSPMLALLMLMIMMSLAGIPPFVGFFAKLSVLQAALDAGFTWVVVFAVLMSVIGAYYYLRVVKLMYMDAPVEPSPVAGDSMVQSLLVVNTLALLVLGLLPGVLLDVCRRAIALSF